MSNTNDVRSGSLYQIDPLIGVDNFPSWRSRMEDVLADQNLLGHAQGLTKKPEPVTREEGKISNQNDIDSWATRDLCTLTQIRLHVSNTVLVYIQNVKH
jgi:hypothetical protein